ncbi:TetR/AcrR family transcriptional regulator [Agilicoccus flavus]|uniref:TetR/AcrR family transcriptional regulator n=1 Tax=Agilicoccus flavus TaxID=2775968 RepID=UPI001CF694BD|nr:TetR/AcrR family transcriptional regulator [Agilicoccus flavus]
MARTARPQERRTSTGPVAGRRRGVGRPKGGGGEQARTALVDAAVDLFAQYGYRGTSMAAIAAAAGLSNTGAAHHFPDKGALLAEVLRRRDAEDTAALGGTWTGWAIFDFWIRLLAHNQTRPGFVRLFTTVAGEAADHTEHPGHAWLVEHHAESVRLLVECLRAGVAEGTVDPQMPVEGVARLTVAISDGLQIQWLDKPDEIDMAHDFAVFVEGLKARWSLLPADRGTPAPDGE